jgi:hypothetical protein
MSKEEILNNYLKGLETLDTAKGFICNAMEEYATIRLKAQELESQKLYEWMLSDKREPAQTYFSSGVIRNIAKEIEFREEKHKEEIEKFLEWADSLYFYSNNMNKWAYRFELGKYFTTTELIEMFKKSLDIK